MIAVKNVMERIPYPVEVRATEGRSLWVSFEDGISGTIDLSHLSKIGGIFDRWDTTVPFSNVFLVPGMRHVIGWDEELEIDADALYLQLIGKTFEEWNVEQEPAYAHH